MDDAEPRTGEHGDRQLRHHRHVQRDPVARFQPAEFAQQRGELVHADIEFLVGDVLDRLVLELGHEMQRGFVALLDEVTIHAVVAGVDLGADVPAPERRLRAVEELVPFLVPVEELGELLVVPRELLEREALEDAFLAQVRLRNKFLRRGEVALLLPVHRDLGFGNIVAGHRFRRAARLFLGHGFHTAPPWIFR